MSRNTWTEQVPRLEGKECELHRNEYVVIHIKRRYYDTRRKRKVKKIRGILKEDKKRRAWKREKKIEITMIL